MVIAYSMDNDIDKKRLFEELTEARQRIADLERLLASSRAKAEKKAVNSEKIVDALVSSSFQLIFLIDRSGVLLAVNDRFSDRFEYKPSEMVGRCVYDFLSPEVAQSRRAFVEEVIRTEKPRRVEDERNGRWLDCAVYPIPDETGQASRLLVYVDDITERKQAEEALRKADEKFRNLFLNATEGIFQTTVEGRFLSANPALAHMLGYDSSKLLMTQVTNVARQIIVERQARQAYLSILHQTGAVRGFQCKMRKADGTAIWGSINAHAVKDGHGKVLHYEGTFQDVTQRKLAQDQLAMQRDLALRLARMPDFKEGLTLILKTALDVSGMESGGIWLKEPAGYLELISSVGFSEHLVQHVQRLDANSPVWSLIMQGETVVYLAPDKEMTPHSYEEGYKYRAIVPILRNGAVVGSLNLLSRHRLDVPDQGRSSLDFLSAESGHVIARMQARQRVEKEVDTRRQAEKALAAEQANLLETNAALRVLLRHREADRRELEDKLVANLKQLVLPYVEKLRKSKLDPAHATMMGFIEANLKEVLSPFLDNMKHFNLTPRQIEIVALIKAGRTTKDMAELLHISEAAVEKHRFLIRKRLGLNMEKRNLRAYLLSLS
jgi:PAS domain S-box-containing protein